MWTHEYPQAKLERQRQLGQLVCRCSTPEPVWLALWRDYECGHCGKAVVW
jgi:hypothetical protein